MIEIVVGIILCVIFCFFAIGAIVVNYEEHEKRRLKKKND